MIVIRNQTFVGTLMLLVSSLVSAQTLNSLSGTGKKTTTQVVTTTQFELLTLTESLTEAPLLLDPQKMIRFDNTSNLHLFNISLVADKSGPLTIRVLQLEFDDAGQVTKQTQILRSDVTGGQERSLRMPGTLLPTGPIYIGLGARGSVKATLTIEKISEEKSRTALEKDSLSANDDLKVDARQRKRCMRLPESQIAMNISVVSQPGVKVEVSAYDKIYAGTLYETYNGKGRIDIVGMSNEQAKAICTQSWGNDGAYRVLTSVGTHADEPDLYLPFTNRPYLTAGQPITRTKFVGDTDVFRLAPTTEGKAYKIDLSGIFSAKACFREPERKHGGKQECINNVRSIYPVIGGDTYELMLSEMIGGDGSYTVEATEVDFDTNQTRLEPNAELFVEQRPPEPNSKSGVIRLSGSHLSASDVDSYHWADIEKEQLWRIRATGQGLVSGEISLDGKTSVRLTKAPGVQSRLQADDVFLTPGRAEVRLRGSAGDYKVFMRPLGAPPAGFELEKGADGSGQVLRFDNTVSGQLKRGDVDRYRLSLTKPVAISLGLAPPIGAEVSVSIGPIHKKRIKHGDKPLQMTLPAGNHELVLTPVIPSPMPYVLRLSRRNPFATENAEVQITHDDTQAIRAWADELQRLTIPIKLNNTSANPVSAELRVETPNYKIISKAVPVVLQANQAKTVEVTLNLLPDIAPSVLPLMVGVVDDNGGLSYGASQIEIEASIDAPTSGAQDIPAVPSRIAGALDLAHRFQGARWARAEGERKLRGDELDNLLDGLWVISERHQAKFNVDDARYPTGFTLKLGTDKPIPLVGVGFALVGAYPLGLGLISLETSIDGVNFEPWFKGDNDHYDVLQTMTGPTRMATHVRMKLAASNDRAGTRRLSEFYVFAEPGKSGRPRQDLLRHGNGAKTHLNQGSPAQQSLMKAKNNRRHQFLKTNDGSGLSLIKGFPISFRNTMSADVEAVELGWSRADNLSEPIPRRLIVMGADSVSGPWREIGSTEIPDPAATADFLFELPERASIRFIRFDYEAKQGWHTLPARLSVFERAVSPGYLSVLGQWGSRRTRSVVDSTLLQDGGALLLDNTQVQGSVQFNSDEDYWFLTPPAASNVISFTVNGAPGFDPELEVSQSGIVLKPLNTKMGIGETRRRVSYRVEPNKEVKAKVTEGQRSIYILANTNGSMKTFRPQILNGIASLSADMVRGQDAVAFSAMSKNSKRPWITDPDKVSRKVVDYFANAKGSAGDAEALTSTAKLMSKRSGTKAIIMISDGSGIKGDAELETALEASRSRLFIMKPPGGVVDEIYAPTNDVLRGWAQIAGGDVQFDTSLAGYERLFSRATAKLRGPKIYSISARSEHRIFEPGSLKVIAGPAVEPEDDLKRSQLVLLDTSGSMLKRINGTRRFAIARKALKEYVASQVTAKPGERFDSIGLRLFGGPPHSCETRLALAPGPFDEGSFASAVDKVTPQNNAKTPIAAALRAAGKDLKSLSGGRLSILLLTDGEETCDGDPLTEIEELAKAGIDARLDVVSFALADSVDRTVFDSWAKAGGGRYVDVQSGAELADALNNSRSRGFQVLDGDKMVAAGQVGAEPIAVPSGAFNIVFEGIDKKFPIVINSGEQAVFAEK